MTPEERLALLDELKTRETRTLSRARITAWLSVLVAVAISAGMLMASYRQLGSLDRQIDAKREELKQVTTQKEQALRERDVVRTDYQACWQSVTSETPPAPQASPPPPPAPSSLPARVYIQTPPGDQALKRAQAAQAKLRQAGFVVPGIEVRPSSPRQTEVRYYKSADAAQAGEVVGILRGLGEQVGNPLHLARYENSTAVRPHHYEVWMAASAQ